MKYFVTGTDTDCGKTYVSCQLLDYWRSKHYKAQALKPLASGSILHEGLLINEDVRRLQAHNFDSKMNINRWQYSLPIAPHLAAQKTSDLISAEAIVEFCEEKALKGFDYVLVEGAGGLMVPLNEEETWVNVLKKSNMPVILVVGLRLGCINHALLTAAVLQENHIQVVGWIANCLQENMLFLEENIEYLSKKIASPLLCILPFCGTISSLPEVLGG